MANSLVTKLVQEQIALSPENTRDREHVHLELDLNLNCAQREVWNVMIHMTQNNSPLRTRLVGVFLSQGSSSALRQLRIAFPTALISLSGINLNK